MANADKELPSSFNGSGLPWIRELTYSLCASNCILRARGSSSSGGEHTEKESLHWRVQLKNDDLADLGLLYSRLYVCVHFERIKSTAAYERQTRSQSCIIFFPMQNALSVSACTLSLSLVYRFMTIANVKD